MTSFSYSVQSLKWWQGGRRKMVPTFQTDQLFADPELEEECDKRQPWSGFEIGYRHDMNKQKHFLPRLCAMQKEQHVCMWSEIPMTIGRGWYVISRPGVLRVLICSIAKMPGYISVSLSHSVYVCVRACVLHACVCVGDPKFSIWNSSTPQRPHPGQETIKFLGMLLECFTVGSWSQDCSCW